MVQTTIAAIKIDAQTANVFRSHSERCTRMLISFLGVERSRRTPNFPDGLIGELHSFEMREPPSGFYDRYKDLVRNGPRRKVITSVWCMKSSVHYAISVIQRTLAAKHSLLK